MTGCVIVCVEKNCPATATRALWTYLWVDGAFCSKNLVEPSNWCTLSIQKARFSTGFLYIPPEKHYGTLWRKKNLRYHTEKHYSTAGQFISVDFANAKRRRLLIEKKIKVTPHTKSCFRSFLSELSKRWTWFKIVLRIKRCTRFYHTKKSRNRGIFILLDWWI